MNWYKTIKEAVSFDATNLNSMEDRNRLNLRIREFKKMAEDFAYLRKYIFQNAPHAQRVVAKYMNDKKMSSYPELKKILEVAYLKARDNYKEFAAICDQILEKIYNEVKQMEDIRSDFVNNVLPERLKKRINK
jgi:hypothetical protein